MTTIKIDAGVLDRVQEALNNAKRKLNDGSGTAYTGAPLAYLDLALTLLETAQPQPGVKIKCTSTHCERRQECCDPKDCTGTAKQKHQPEMTDDQRKAALEAFEKEIVPQIYTSQKKRIKLIETIRTALLAPSVQDAPEMEVYKNCGCSTGKELGLIRAIASKYSDGLRIVRGEGEKNG